jgi:hypothetical protein
VLVLLLLAQGASAETSRHRSGFFKRAGNLWVEHLAHNAAGLHFAFKEKSRNAARGAARPQPGVLAPYPGRRGASTWTILDRHGWVASHDMTREP